METLQRDALIPMGWYVTMNILWCNNYFCVLHDLNCKHNIWKINYLFYFSIFLSYLFVYLFHLFVSINFGDIYPRVRKKGSIKE